MKKHINTTENLGKTFYLNYHDKGKITMLNLLKFNEIADYTGLDEISPNTPISGREAYDLYMKLTLPFLELANSKVIYTGESKNFLIGPDKEEWDMILMVEHESVAKFMAFANNQDYLKIAGHRTAALADSRLLPSIKIDA